MAKFCNSNLTQNLFRRPSEMFKQEGAIDNEGFSMDEKTADDNDSL